MDIVENREAWTQHFTEKWLSVVEKTDKSPPKVYEYVTNTEVPGLPGTDLRDKRLILISTAGAYLKDRQVPFDAPNLVGDYSIRTWPVDTPFDQLAIAHDHYEHTAINADFQTCIPTRHLRAMVDAGEIGALASEVISFSGYTPDVRQVVDVTIAAMLNVAQELGAEAALFAPVWPICHQSGGLAARAFELAGIPSVVVGCFGGVLRKAAPPRTIMTRFPRGIVFGHPHDHAQQDRVLRAALDLLSKDAPLEPLRLDEE